MADPQYERMLEALKSAHNAAQSATDERDRQMHTQNATRIAQAIRSMQAEAEVQASVEEGDGFTAQMNKSIAEGIGGLVDFVKQLTNKSVQQVDVQDIIDKTPLHYAAQVKDEKYVDIAKNLIPLSNINLKELNKYKDFANNAKEKQGYVAFGQLPNGEIFYIPLKSNNK